MKITFSLNTPLKQQHFRIPEIRLDKIALFDIYGYKSTVGGGYMDIIHFDGLVTLRNYRNCGSAIPSN